MKKKRDTLLYYLLLIITLIAAIFLLRLIKIYAIFCYILDLILPVLLGFVFAWLLLPLYRWLNKKINPKISILIIVVLFISVYVTIGYLVVPIFLRKFTSLFNILKDYLVKFKNVSFLKFDEKMLMVKPKDFIASCGGIISIVINVVLIHIFGIYILYNYDNISKYMKNKIIKCEKTKILNFIDNLSINMRLYIKGVVIDTAILFIITFIVFSILNLRYSLLLSLFISITNIIPFVGPYIGGIPAVLIALNKSKKLAAFIIIFLFLSQEIESDVINPMVMSKCIRINPLLIVISVTLAGKVLGIIGMIFAVPILILVKLFYDTILQNKKSVQHV